MSENGSNGHRFGTSAERQAAARAVLEPLVNMMVPDVRSALTITRSLITTYYNLDYIGDDVRLLDALAGLKVQGVLHREALGALREICRAMDLRPEAPVDPHHAFLRQLNIMQEILPDHLHGPDGKIVWTADRPPKWPPPVQPVAQPSVTVEQPVPADPPSLAAK